MYTTFSSTGEKLPPVILVSFKMEKSTDPDRRFYDDHGNYAYVEYIPGLGAASEHSTIVWWEKMTLKNDYQMHPDSLLIFDALQGHVTAEMQANYEKAGVKPCPIPGGAGKWLNPLEYRDPSQRSSTHSNGAASLAAIRMILYQNKRHRAFVLLMAVARLALRIDRRFHIGHRKMCAPNTTSCHAAAKCAHTYCT